VQEDTVDEQLFEGRRRTFGINRASGGALAVGMVLGGLLAVLPSTEEGRLDVSASCFVDDAGFPRLDAAISFASGHRPDASPTEDPVIVGAVRAPAGWMPFLLQRFQAPSRYEGTIERWVQTTRADHVLGTLEADDVREASLRLSVWYEALEASEIRVLALMIDVDGSLYEAGASVDCAPGTPPPDFGITPL